MPFFPLADLAIQRFDGDFLVTNVVLLCVATPTTLYIGILGRYMILEADAKGAGELESTGRLSETVETTPTKYETKSSNGDA